MTSDNKTTKRIQFLFIIAITVLIFYLIFQNIDLDDVISVLLNADKFYILLSVIPLGISLLFNAARWQRVLHAMGYEIALQDSFVIFMAAIPFSSVTPSKSGDLVRAYYMKNKIPVDQTAGSVVTERIFDLAILVVLSLIGICFSGMYGFTILLFLFLVLLAGFIIFLYKAPRLPVPESWNQTVQNFSLSLKKLMENRRDLLSVMVFSLVIWILAIIQTILLFSALSINVPLFYLIGTLPIAILVGMIPVTLGGMGTRDAAFILLLSSYATSGQLLAGALLFTLFRYWLLAIAGLPFMKIALKEI